ncbi:MAG TPA: hypothetical protein VGK87_05530 [Anaerolineae bacterium]|jgi:hypothetical protein
MISTGPATAISPALDNADAGIAAVLPRVTIAAVWHDTLLAFSAHSASILGSAFLGFALSAIAASALGAVITLEQFTRTNTILVSYGLNRTVPLIVQGALGLCTGALARGMITWRVLNPATGETRMRIALRAALPSWLPLTFVLFITGLLLFAGNLGLNAMLTEQKIDFADISQLSATPDGMLRSIILRTIDISIPNPGAPFSEALSYIQLESSRVSTELVYAGGLSYYYVKNVQDIPLSTVFGVAGIVVLFGVDALQRFVVAAIVQTRKAGWLKSVGAAIKLAARNFGLVLAHIWLVRLVVFIVSTIFMTVPLVLTQSTLVPLLIRSTGTAWPYLVSGVLLSVSIALVSMVLTALGVVYDACLYRRLVNQTRR